MELAIFRFLSVRRAAAPPARGSPPADFRGSSEPPPRPELEARSIAADPTLQYLAVLHVYRGFPG
jgi:hypothetical protein